MSSTNDWLNYALSMADNATAGGREFTLVASRLEALPLVGEVDNRLRRIASQSGNASEADAARAARGLYSELARWLLEFMIAASYVRREQGLTEDELAIAVGRWFSRLGEELTEAGRKSIARSILVKSLLNDARPFMVASMTDAGIAMVEAPLLVRVAHGRYYVTDEAENYLYHIDSTIDEFASDYSLIAARMGRELDSKSYGKSSRTVKEMIARVGHVRRQMDALVEDTGHLGPDEQWERYELIRGSVETIREHREVVQRYHEEVARIWENWANYDAVEHARETRGDQLASLRSLEEGLRVLTAVESWMYDEYAGLSDRCAQVTRHYLRSSVVTTLFSLDDLMSNVAHAGPADLDWLDLLLLPVTCPTVDIDFAIPPMASLDDMVRSPRAEAEAPTLDLEAMLDNMDADVDEHENEQALELARRFARWLNAGGGDLDAWLAQQTPEQVYDAMASHDLTRLIASFLCEPTSGEERAGHGKEVAGDAAPITSFADPSWVSNVLGGRGNGVRVVAEPLDGSVAYEGSQAQDAVRGILDNIRFEVTNHA